LARSRIAHPAPFASIPSVEEALTSESYLPERGLATGIYLAVTMQRPLLLEGEAGVGKTEVAKTLARVLDADLIRLQCYEGIDAAQALYEWDYAGQLLHMQMTREGSLTTAERKAELYSEEFLIERPLMAAVRAGPSAVLLIDEVDRADDEFEALLLEFLSDYSVSVPEIGTVTATAAPVVVLTSNRTRELHDALKRRCFYHWIDFPTAERETEIIRMRVPGIAPALAEAVAVAIERMRELDLIKAPGAAEAIDWARALTVLGADQLTPDSARATLGWAIKNHEDLVQVEAQLADVVG
jgi:MoxR-like ATPase